MAEVDHVVAAVDPDVVFFGDVVFFVFRVFRVLEHVVSRDTLFLIDGLYVFTFDMSYISIIVIYDLRRFPLLY
mgnify:CR=1 FL=1